MLIATILAELFIYPVEAWRLSRVRLWMPTFDLLALLSILTIWYVSSLIWQ